MSNVNFSVSPEEKVLIDKIIERVGQIWPTADRTSTAMDLVATHNHICKLRLEDLLNASDFNFAHDVAGIGRHLDRRRLVLMRGFWPRFAVRGQ